MTIRKFKESIDYRDICHFMVYMLDDTVLCSCLEELGYTKGYIIQKENLGMGHVTIDKKGNFRIQLRPKFKHLNMAICIIVDHTKIRFKRK